MTDRFGIAWRPQLAAGIFAHREEFDLVEVIADDYLHASRGQLRALRALCRHLPVVLHGISLGLASTSVVEEKRLVRFARVIGETEPEFWSEHLAFVRGGGFEIGHLAAPPRTLAAIEGTAHNLDRVRRVVGSAPLLENIATLIDPPGSPIDEPAWIAETLAVSGCGLLLDLHNVYANCLNFGRDPLDFLRRIPLEKVAAIHLAGGRWIVSPGVAGRPHRRMLDDHLHDVPQPVYELLSEVARLVPQPLTVLLERDGNYPPVEQLIAELHCARSAVARGRAGRAATPVARSS